MAGGLSSQLGRLVAPERVPSAFGLDGLTYNVAGIMGPAVAAALSGLASAQTATLALAGLGLTGAVVLLAARTRVTRAGGSESLELAKVETPLLAGVRAIVRDRLLGATTLATAAAQVGLGALAVVLAASAKAEGDPTRAGWLLSAMAGGAVLGSLLWTARPASAARAPLVIALGLASTGSALVGLAWLRPSSYLSVGLFILAGMAGALAFGATLVVRDDRAPLPLRGQVFSLAAGAKITAGALGAALGGVLQSLPLPMSWVAAAPLAAGLLLVPVASKGAAGQERR